MKLNLSIFLSIVFLSSIGGFAQKTGPAKTEIKPTDEKSAPSKAVVKLPTVKEILEKYVQAIGGREANEKIKSRMSKGTVEIAPMGIKGTAEAFQSAPDKSYSKTTLAGIGDIIESFDGTTAWTINPIQGNRDKTGNELAQTKLMNNFYREINLGKIYPKMEVKGIEKVGDNETYVVVAMPVGLEPETFYFDVKSGLLMRSDLTMLSPEGKTPAKAFYEDFRDVDGVKVPFKLRVVLPQFEVITVVTELKHNVAVENSLFAKPK